MPEESMLEENAKYIAGPVPNKQQRRLLVYKPSEVVNKLRDLEAPDLFSVLLRGTGLYSGAPMFDLIPADPHTFAEEPPKTIRYGASIIDDIRRALFPEGYTDMSPSVYIVGAGASFDLATICRQQAFGCYGIDLQDLTDTIHTNTPMTIQRRILGMTNLNMVSSWLKLFSHPDTKVMDYGEAVLAWVKQYNPNLELVR